MNEFIIFYTPSRGTFLEDATPEELTIVDRHFEYLQAELGRGRLIVAGRRLERPMGIAVFEAEDETAAQWFMENDPAVKSGVFQAEVGPYRVALLRR